MKIVKKAGNVLQYVKCLILYLAAALVSLFVRRSEKYRDLWLVAERGADARDNGYHFFRYLRMTHPEINCVYAIDDASPDYARVSALGRTVRTGSFAHYVAFVCAAVKISTHVMGYAPDAYRFAILDRKAGIVKGKKVFLQHGIINNDISELRHDMLKLDLFICSTTGEYEALSGYGHPDGVLRRIGLCRYDALEAEHEVKRQILVMPTWRYYLRPLDDKEFCESEYYREFNSLLTDERLHRILEENDYELAFYVHYELQKFSPLFSSTGSPRVKVRTMADSDVQKLLMESAMLITDYSSVFFDFAYMRKPLAHWMFDYDLFYADQYGEGYMKLKTDGFGPACRDKDDVVDLIEYEIQNGMTVDEPYRTRIENTFAGLPSDHCEQTYRAILDLFK